jgi:hypothetical protein
MSDRRLLLHEELVGVLQTRHVYYQPPESIKLTYPAIIYSRQEIGNVFADNEVYKQAHRYRVIIIDADPDSEITERMSKFATAKYERNYKANGLNHDVFSIIY